MEKDNRFDSIIEMQDCEIIAQCAKGGNATVRAKGRALDIITMLAKITNDILRDTNISEEDFNLLRIAMKEDSED